MSAGSPHGATSVRPPSFAFQWNGEIRLLDVANDEDLPKDEKSLHRAVRCCTQVLVKRLPAALADGASIDFNIQLSAAMENEKTLLNGMIHILQTLTCHTKRPGDADPFYYVALEHCDYNLEQAVGLTQQYIRNVRTGSSSPHGFNEDEAPLLLWRARRSIARQLVAGVAFLHRTGIGAYRRIYHNNLKPTNILLKNGVAKLSEVNCFSHSDAAHDGSLVVPLHDSCHSAESSPFHVTTPFPVSKDGKESKDDLSKPRASPPPPVLSDEAALQAEFVPALTLEDVEGMAQLEAIVSSANSAGGGRNGRLESSPVRLGGKVEPSSGKAGKADVPPTTTPTASTATTGAGSTDEITPEAAARKLYKLRAYRDTFALGCLIFYTLTLGKHPFGRLGKENGKPGTAAVNVMKGVPHTSRQIAASLEAAASNAAAQARFVAAVLEKEPFDTKESPHAMDGGATAIPGIAQPKVHTTMPGIDSPLEPRASHIDNTAFVVPSDVISNRAADILLSYKDVVSGRRPSFDRDLSEPTSPSEVLRAVRIGSEDLMVPTPVPFVSPHEDIAGARGSSAADVPHTMSLPIIGRSSSGARTGFEHKYHMSPVDPVDNEEATDLVAGLIDSDVKRRITVADALAHPFFWSTARKFLFIQTISESIVVNQDRATGEHAAFAGDIQSHFLARMPAGVTAWSSVFRPPSSLGAEGWGSPQWTHKHPSEYENNYSGPYNMYSLVRFIRNFYVHGPEHIRQGVFESLSHLEAYILSAWPWLVIELFKVDQLHGGKFTAFTLAGGTGSVAHLLGGGVDADIDASHVGNNIATTLEANETAFIGLSPAADSEESPITEVEPRKPPVSVAPDHFDKDDGKHTGLHPIRGDRAYRPPRRRRDSFAKDMGDEDDSHAGAFDMSVMSSRRGRLLPRHYLDTHTRHKMPVFVDPRYISDFEDSEAYPVRRWNRRLSMSDRARRSQSALAREE